MRVTTTAAAAKLIVAAVAIAVGALALGSPVAYADDAVVDPAATVQGSSTTVSEGEPTATERRKARVYIIGKTTKPYTRQG